MEFLHRRMSLCLPPYLVQVVPRTRRQLACMVPLAPLSGPYSKELPYLKKTYETMQEEVREKILIRHSEQLIHSVVEWVFS